MVGKVAKDMGNRKALWVGMSSKRIMLKVREDGEMGNKEIIGIDLSDGA